MSQSSTLHLILTDAAEAWARCSRVRRDEDSILFLADGVLRFDEPGRSGPNVAYSRADLDARGLLQAAEASALRLFEDGDFATLLARHRHCLSWK